MCGRLLESDLGNDDRLPQFTSDDRERDPLGGGEVPPRVQLVGV